MCLENSRRSNMPSGSWKTSEQYLTSKETFLQIKEFLESGLNSYALEVVNEILEDMELAEREGR
jgi:hypothetical protein